MPPAEVFDGVDHDDGGYLVGNLLNGVASSNQRAANAARNVPNLYPAAAFLRIRGVRLVAHLAVRLEACIFSGLVSAPDSSAYCPNRPSRDRAW